MHNIIIFETSSTWDFDLNGTPVHNLCHDLPEENKWWLQITELRKGVREWKKEKKKKKKKERKKERIELGEGSGRNRRNVDPL